MTNSNGKICNLKCREIVSKVIHGGKWDPTWLYIYIMGVGKHINIKSVYVIFVQDKNVCSLCTVWCTFLMFVIASSLKCVYDTLPNTRVEN